MDFINSVVYSASAFVKVCYILLGLTNTLAFYITDLIKAIKGFAIEAQGYLFPSCINLI
jgi:hypothetical protein